MKENTAQGVISTAGTNVLTAPSTSAVKLNTFTVHNSLAYTFTIIKHNKKFNITTTIYSVNLSAGDTVIDSRTYYLEPGDYIRFVSSVAGTTFELLSTEYGSY